MYLTNQGVEAIVIPLYEEFGDECIDAVGNIVEGIEFEQGDFEDCIFFTIEEAKHIQELLEWNNKQFATQLSKEGVDLLNSIKERIEQSEGKR